MTIPDVPPQVVIASVAAGFGVTVALVLVLAAVRALRHVQNRQLLAVGLLTGGLAAGTFATSFVKVSEWAKSPWPGLFIDASIVVFVAMQLILEPRGKRVPLMNWAQWALLGVTMLANAQGEDDLAHSVLHASQPALLKIAVTGLKALILADAGVEILDRVPLRRWLRDPFGARWISRQIVLGRVSSYADAVQLDNRVAMRDVERRVERETNGQRPRWFQVWLWRRPVSARDLVLLDALTTPMPPRPGRPSSTRQRSRPSTGKDAAPLATVEPVNTPEVAPAAARQPAGESLGHPVSVTADAWFAAGVKAHDQLTAAGQPFNRDTVKGPLKANGLPAGTNEQRSDLVRRVKAHLAEQASRQPAAPVRQLTAVNGSGN